MADSPDKSGGQVRLPRPVRILLAALVVATALVFLLAAIAILVADRSQMPSPQGALVIALFLLALGLGFGFIGVRLIRIKETTDHLFSIRAAMVSGPLISVLGLVVAISALYHQQMDAVYAGFVLVFVGFGVYRSGRQRKSALKRSLTDNKVTAHPRPQMDPGGAGNDLADAGKPAAVSGGRNRVLGWIVAIFVAAVGAVVAVKGYRTERGSEWMTATQYQRQFDARAREGYYPHEVEGECRSGGERFRADWKAIPSGAAFFAHHGMTRQDYERRDQEYRSKGFTLESLKYFQDCSGIDRYQATWLKR